MRLYDGGVHDAVIRKRESLTETADCVFEDWRDGASASLNPREWKGAIRQSRLEKGGPGRWLVHFAVWLLSASLLFFS